MELKEMELKDGDSIEFVERTDIYGRAEFVVCSRYKRKKIVELFIYPTQQKNVNNYYVWRGDGRNSLTIGSFHNLDNPKIWFFNYCSEHKCQSFRMYVPNESRFLRLSVLSDLSLYFTKTRIK